MKRHELKTWPPFFDYAVDGLKTFEIRNNDRDFAVGDIIMLMEWDNCTRQYTGRSAPFRINYILKAEDLPSKALANGHVIMTIEPSWG